MYMKGRIEQINSYLLVSFCPSKQVITRFESVREIRGHASVSGGLPIRQHLPGPAWYGGSSSAKIGFLPIDIISEFVKRKARKMFY